MKKYIIHIDINAFFPAVEEALNPKLKDKPLVVAGKTKRSVVASANYPARALGIKSAMPIFEAVRKCKNLIILPPNFRAYEEYSNLFFSFIRKNISNKVEPFSFDECFIDITDVVLKKKMKPIDVASDLQKKVFKELGLKTSIGIANTKFLAKMGSDYKKPMGLTEIFTTEEIKNYLYPQQIENILFIGHRSAEKLRKIGIKSVEDFVVNKNNIQKKFGDIFDGVYENLSGYGDDEVIIEESDYKSISCSETLLNNSNDYEEIKLKLNELCSEVYERITYLGFSYKTLTLTVRNPNFITKNKAFTFKSHQKSFNSIFLKSLELWERFFSNTTVRLLGVSLGKLKGEYDYARSEIFDLYEKDYDETSKIIEDVNRAFNQNILQTANKKLKK